MSGLYVGAAALQTGNNALNTTAHNLTNVDNKYYTRQQVSLADRQYLMINNSKPVVLDQTGLGVKYAETRQVRDAFLDKTYRREYGRASFYEMSADALEYIEDILKEQDDDQAFSAALNDMWKTVQELANEPGSSVVQGLFVSKSQTFLSRADAVYHELQDYQHNLNTHIKDIVKEINEYGKKIADLSDAIVKIEIGGVENANDLKDKRNEYIDKLSQLAKIDVSYDVDGYCNIRIENEDFLKRESVYTIGLEEDDYGFVTPYWEINAEKKDDGTLDISHALVFDMTREISAELNTDVGKLKSMLVSRGDHYGSCQDLAYYRSQIKDILNDDLKADADKQTEINTLLHDAGVLVTGEEYTLGMTLTGAQEMALDQADKDYYDINIRKFTCTNIQAEFDQIVNGIVTNINQLLKDAGYTDGIEASEAHPDNLLFVRNAEASGWHVGNISVNMRYIQSPSLMRMKKDNGEIDYDTATALKDAFAAEDYVLNPDLTQKLCFKDYYTALVEQVTNSASVSEALKDAQMKTSDAAYEAREQILGVSSDEELQFMITFQNAYNASSRYITTINDMLESIITSYGA